MCVNICEAQTTKKSPTVDGKVKFASTSLPLPLGRYVQLSTPSASYKFSKPNRNGNGTYTVNFKFDILRHVPNIEYIDFKLIQRPRVDKFNDFVVRFDRDQLAEEKLANAISSGTSSRVNIAWKGEYEDKVQLEVNGLIKQWNNKEAIFDQTEIDVFVSPARISVNGINSQKMRFSKPAKIRLLTAPGRRDIEISLFLEPLIAAGFNANVTATIRTKDGSYQMSFLNKNLYIYLIIFHSRQMIISLCEIWIGSCRLRYI